MTPVRWAAACALRYLSVYVFRTAISDKRIVSVGEDSLAFAYTDIKTGVEELMSLKPFEFIRRFRRPP